MSLGSKKASYAQVVPPDLQGLRGQQLQFLQQILGNGANSSDFQNFFGHLGSPTTDLQRQSAGGISQFLNQPAPEQQALQTALPALQKILAGNPGQGVIEALQPQFQRNLAQANQQGGRFSSGNEILRSRAVGDFNLLAANAAQQGQQTQLNAASTLNMLSGAAGNNPFQRLLGAFGIGQEQAGQNDLETQRRLGLLAQILGVGQQTAFNLPIVQTSGAQQGLGQQIAGAAIGTAGTIAGKRWGR